LDQFQRHEQANHDCWTMLRVLKSADIQLPLLCTQRVQSNPDIAPNQGRRGVQGQCRNVKMNAALTGSMTTCDLASVSPNVMLRSGTAVERSHRRCAFQKGVSRKTTLTGAPGT